MLSNFINQLHITEEELIQELSEHATITQHDKGELLIKNKQYIKVLKIVLSGKVRVYQENEHRQILIYYLTAMETCTLSLSACFVDCKSNVNAVVEEDSTILNIPIRFIKDWNLKYNSWNAFTISTFRESYSLLLNRYSQLAFSPLKERLLDYLISESNNATLQRSHQQIAKELGTTREVVSRLLKKLELDGKLQLGQKEIKLFL
jgi:CRP/FNR family transcriptional regulator